ncbi:MAG: LTA synthase family protein, partial [Bacteroidota bacterium]
SGMPSFMNKPYINSSYAGNRINSFPQLLKKLGYTTAFFHGGKNGTMNFDSYAKSAGYDHYYGMNEYNNDDDFDGNWGIWDEPYLQYCVKEFTKMKTPFFTSVFTLSSHHPFKIPNKYKNRFQKINLECSESVSYSDHALKEFFSAAKKEDWFDNTLFVIVPDHTGISADPFYANPVGQHTIPIIFYTQDGMMKGENKNLTQQIDILPTVLDTLGYQLPFFSFGKSAFKKQHKQYSIFFENGNYFLVNDSMCFTFLDHQLKQVFNFNKDSTLSQNLVRKNKDIEKDANEYYRNFLQLYHHSLLKNSAFKE